MSLTKRYLESLPADEQDAILGRFDEWTNDAENGPDESGIDPDYEAWRASREADEELAEEEPNDPLVKCRICHKTWPISEMNKNGECPDCQLEEWERRENALLVKPIGKCVTLKDNNGVEWRL